MSRSPLLKEYVIKDSTIVGAKYKEVADAKIVRLDEGKAVDNGLVIMESNKTESEVQDDSSRSGNDTDVDDADIRPIYDEEPMDEVQLTAECNIFAIGQQHTEQHEIINKGRVDKYLEKCQVKSPMLDSSPDNQTTKYSKQSIESKNILLKKNVAQFQKVFSRMEAHCIAFELKCQNQSLKSGQHGQILNESNNKTKIKKEIDVLETMNIELEHSVAKLRKENESLKKHYKDLYDSIKITRSKTIEQTTSLLAINADLKAQIQEKVFAIDALKNDLRKLKGNSVDTKFDKTSVLGKPVLPSLRNQSVVRQPNAFKSECPQMSKQRFASQIDVNNSLSKPVTQHYLPKKTKTAFAKPDHMIASSSSRNSSKNMPRFSSNDMEVNSHAKIQSNKTRNRNKPVDQKSHTQKPSRQIFTGYRFSPNKTSAVYEKTSFRSYLRWKPKGRIFKYVGLKWIPTGKTFDSCTGKVDSELTHGSNVDIPNIHFKPRTTTSTEVPKADMILMTSMIELESIFGPLFDVAVTTADASDKCQQQPDSTSSTSTLATTVTADGNFDL
ncbi:hypothetical protein Tco_0437897 [Tanacetum coccineum]